jgi:hypothetical protein
VGDFTVYIFNQINFNRFLLNFTKFIIFFENRRGQGANFLVFADFFNTPPTLQLTLTPLSSSSSIRSRSLCCTDPTILTPFPLQRSLCSCGLIGHKLVRPSPLHILKVGGIEKFWNFSRALSSLGYKLLSLESLQVLDIVVHLNHARPMSTATVSKVPVGARKVWEHF